MIAKNLAAGAAFSRDSHLQGAPARPDRKLTSGEFRKQYELVIASCESCDEMDCRVVINATVGCMWQIRRYFSSPLVDKIASVDAPVSGTLVRVLWSGKANPVKSPGSIHRDWKPACESGKFYNQPGCFSRCPGSGGSSMC